MAMPKKEVQSREQNYVTSGRKILGLNINRASRIHGEMDRVASSKNSQYKKKLFSDLLVKSGYYSKEHANKISEILSSSDDKTINELQSVLVFNRINEQNNVVKALTGNELLLFRGRRVEDMLKNNYNDVAKAFVNELHKNDFFMNKIDDALTPKTPQPLLAAQQVQHAPVDKSRNSTRRKKTYPASTVYNIKNSGSIQNVGPSKGSKFTFAGTAGKTEGKKQEQQPDLKMMESILAYNQNISDHLKALQNELGKPVERRKGGFEFSSYKKPEEAALSGGAKTEAEQLEFPFKEKTSAGQLEIPFGRLNALIKKTRESPTYENLRDLYGFNSKPAREAFDKIMFESQSGDEAQFNALKILLKNRDFSRMARAVKSENWGFSKLQALERIGNTINNSNKEDAVKLFSDMLKEKEVDEYYLTIHKTLDKIKDEKTKNYVFEKLKPSLLEAENKIKPEQKKSKDKTIFGEDALDFFKPPEEVKKDYTNPELNEVGEYEAKVKKINQWIKNQKKESET